MIKTKIGLLFTTVALAVAPVGVASAKAHHAPCGKGKLAKANCGKHKGHAYGKGHKKH